MKVQYNIQTKMTWTYVPTSVVRDMDLKKGDEIEFVKVENFKDPQYTIKKTPKTEQK